MAVKLVSALAPALLCVALCLPFLGLGDATAQQGGQKAVPKGGQQGTAPKGGQQGAPPNPPATGSGQAGVTYPSRPLRIFVGFAPGGAVDVTARQIALALTERLGQPIIVENRPGGAGNIAAQEFLRAAPDGHTLYLTSSANAINAAVTKPPFDFLRDSEPVGAIMRTPNVMVLAPSAPTKSITGFMEQARANPNKLVWASGGNGTMGHLSGELFKMMSGVSFTHVFFPGVAPALQAVLGGHADIMCENVSVLLPQINAGNLRAVAVTSAQRVPALPSVSTVGESLPGYETSGFYGLSVPKGTPRDVIDRLNRELNSVLADQKVQSTLANFGGMLIPGIPADFGKIVADDTEKWAKVVAAGGIKPQ